MGARRARLVIRESEKCKAETAGLIGPSRIVAQTFCQAGFCSYTQR